MKITGNLVNKSLLLTVLLALNSTTAAQGLPEGEGLEVIVVSCTQCHGLDRLTKVRLTGAQWENALYDMMARGAIVEKRDLATVREYLVQNLAVDGEED